MFSLQIRSRRVRVITEVKSNLVESSLWMQNLDAEGIDDESPGGVRDISWSALTNSSNRSPRLVCEQST